MIQQYSGKAHGAFLSGLRVASEILSSGASDGDQRWGAVLLLAALVVAWTIL